eukprot:gene22941-27740_t
MARACPARQHAFFIYQVLGLFGHTEGLTHVSSKGDGRYCISNSKDQTIKLWDVRKIMANDKSNAVVTALIGTRLDGGIYVWDVLTGKLLRRNKAHHGTVRDVSWHPTKASMVSVSWDTTIVEWSGGSNILNVRVLPPPRGVYMPCPVLAGSRPVRS